MEFLCVYSTCDRKYISAEALARHIERDHADPGPKPSSQDERSAVFPAGAPVGLGNVGGTPRRTAFGNGPNRARPKAPARTRSTRAQRTYWRDAQRRHRVGESHQPDPRPRGAFHPPMPLFIPQADRCPGRRTPRPEQGWLTQYNNSCGVEISATRDRCAFHRRAE